MIEIRVLESADAEAFQALRLRGLRESPAAFGSTFEEEVGRTIEQIAERLTASRTVPRRATFGAFDENGVLVGVVALVQESHLKMRHKASIYAMYVSSEARGRGVGRALLARLIEHAKTWDGVERLNLTVTVGQDSARQLYRSAGFRLFGTEADALRQDGESQTMEYMTLALIDRDQ